VRETPVILHACASRLPCRQRQGLLKQAHCGSGGKRESWLALKGRKPRFGGQFSTKHLPLINIVRRGGAGGRVGLDQVYSQPIAAG
jgi:hypothetical protein